MENTISLALIGVFLLFLVIGFLAGVIRGLKRSSMHIVFVIVATVLAFLLTKTITNMILGITIPANGTTQTIGECLVGLIESSFNISDFKTATDFALAAPMAIASPFVFLALQVVLNTLFGIVYAIVARLSFGKKKEDFAKHKPYRAFGGVVGVVEGLFVLVLTFAPLTCLSKTVEEILYTEATTTASSVEICEANTNKMQTLGEMMEGKLPKEVKQYIKLYNNSVFGKVTGAMGFDTLMYDHLSSFTLNGETIVFRKDLVDTAKTYDNFVVIYNELNNENYDVSVKDLVKSLKDLTSSGLFKTVVCDTVRDLVVNYDTLKENLKLELPQFAEDIVSNMHDIFADKKFNAYEYIKHDINLLLDVFENVVESDTLKNISTIEESSISNILKFVDENTEVLSTNVKNLLNLNLASDNFEIIIDEASKTFAGLVENTEDLEISLNGKISKADRQNMVDRIFTIAENLKDINDELSTNEMSLNDLISGDTFTKLTELDNIDSVFAKIGDTLDNARDFELLVIPESTSHPTKTYVLDNILKCYKMELLGDSEDYKEFFTSLTTPIKNIKELGLVDVINGEELNIVTILDKVKANDKILSETIVPFYQFKNTKIGEKTLKEMVFDEVISALSDKIDILDFSEYQIEANESITNWADAFEDLGKTLKDLHSGNVGGKTYAKFLIDGGDITTLSMEEIGTIIDIIKVNAKNEGSTLRGVLNDKFAEVVYMMTGDKLIATKDYSSLTKIGEGDDNKYQDIKTYINVSNVEEYYDVKFAEKLAELSDSIDLANEIITAIDGKSFTSNPDEVVSAIRTAIENAGYTDGAAITENVVAVFENIEKISSNPSRKLVDISDLDTEEKKQAARDKIDAEFSNGTIEEAIAESIKNILGL